MKGNENDDCWARRRRNLKAYLAANDRSVAEVSRKSGLSVNTLGKFLRGETRSIRWDTLEAICKEIGITNAAFLDTDNPLSVSKLKLYKMIDEMPEEKAREALNLLEGHFKA